MLKFSFFTFRVSTITMDRVNIYVSLGQYDFENGLASICVFNFTTGHFFRYRLERVRPLKGRYLALQVRTFNREYK